jgi:hypothetical protein
VASDRIQLRMLASYGRRYFLLYQLLTAQLVAPEQYATIKAQLPSHVSHQSIEHRALSMNIRQVPSTEI